MSNKNTDSNLKDEQELIQLCKKGDRQAQRLLFEKYSGKMMAVCLRYAKNKEDARDLLHDGFVKVFSNIKSFKGESALSTWMTRLFINLSLNSFRDPRFKFEHKEWESKHETFEEIDEKDFLQKYDAGKVVSAIKSLPAIYKVVLNLYAVDGLTHKEIGKALGISEGSSKSRLSRARVLLLNELKIKSN